MSCTNNMYQYRCNDCGYIWDTSLTTTRCASHTCLQFNVSEVSDSPECSYSNLDDCFDKMAERWNKILDKLGEPHRRRMSEWLDYVKEKERE